MVWRNDVCLKHNAFEQFPPQIHAECGQVHKLSMLSGVRLLLERWKDHDQNIRRVAVEALSEIAKRGDGEVNFHLLQCLEDDDLELDIRQTAVEALSEFAEVGDIRTIEALWALNKRLASPANGAENGAEGSLLDTALHVLVEIWSQQHDSITGLLLPTWIRVWSNI